MFTGVSKPTCVKGLATFDKKVVLFGSEGGARVFESKFKENGCDVHTWDKTNLPKAVVEVVDPIALSAKLVDVVDCCDDCCTLSGIPDGICKIFDDEEFILDGDKKRVYVSLGLFTIVKIERSVQLLIPAYDFCIPCKECVSATEDNPCELFEKLKFPIDEFFPKKKDCDSTDFDGKYYRD